MKQLLLLGAGHAHAQVLRAWAAAPLAGCALVIVSPSGLAPYSGMVPGWLAGNYGFDEICINFAALAQAAGARLVIDSVAALDADQRQVHLASGAVLGYDLLSLNVGSTLNPPDLQHAGADAAGQQSGQAASRVLCMRPLGGLHSAWTTLLADPALRSSNAPLTVTAVGGGAAGVESLLAVLARLRALQPGRQCHGKLLTRSTSLLPGMAPGAVRAASTALAAAGAQVLTNTGFKPDQNGSGLLLWATGAEAHAWQRSSGLAVSERGFICVNSQLQSTSHPNVFAVGDCADWAPPLPKAGVYAVRMGPTLTHNLRAALGPRPGSGGGLMDYQPQHRFLALLATADGSAAASWGPLSAHGRWVLRWKDKIDRRFLQQFKR